jgi:Prokaryotic homologs of the JAB domain
MAAHEVFFLIGPDDELLYADESGSPSFLPDSRTRWEAIWCERERLVEIAHSHPNGPLGFSEEDESTMTALASALGRRLTFSVVAPNGMIRREQAPAPAEGAAANWNSGTDVVVRDEPPWAATLRSRSEM